MGTRLLELFGLLSSCFGPQNWWPSDTRFETIVGAILTQNTAWQNAKKGLRALKREGLLTPDALHRVEPKRMAALIRAAGYYNLKAARLRSFLDYLFSRYSGSLDTMFRTGPGRLREELLGVWGIGPETADSILLYAGGIPSFVVDAYTKRVLFRHGLIEGEAAPYEEVRRLFMDNLPADAALFNEFHALFVKVGKEFCRKRPLCGGCPLEGLGDGQGQARVT